METSKKIKIIGIIEVICIFTLVALLIWSAYCNNKRREKLESNIEKTQESNEIINHNIKKIRESNNEIQDEIENITNKVERPNFIHTHTEAIKEIDKPIITEVVKEIEKPIITEVVKEIEKPVITEVVKEVVKEVDRPVITEVVKEVEKPVVKEVVKDCDHEKQIENLTAEITDLIQSRKDTIKGLKKIQDKVGELNLYDENNVTLIQMLNDLILKKLPQR